MGDLFNNFPNWGETGEYPTPGFFYEGGDQVNEKHLDALWNGVKTHIDNLNTGVRDRVRKLHGNVVLDQGLVASTGGGTREVDVTASSAGAFVDGQFTGSTSADTVTLTANGTGSTRTDVVWVDTDGNIGKTEDTQTVASNRLKIAEVDVATDDSISAVRNYARDHVHTIASENQPDSAEPGDFWYDLTNKREQVYQDSNWRTLITNEDDLTFTAGDGLDGGGTVDLVGGASLNPSVDVTDLLGTGITEDGSNNLLLDESVIKDGGTLEIDAAEFAGDGGSVDQYLQTDGTSAQWNSIPDSYLIATDSLYAPQSNFFFDDDQSSGIGNSSPGFQFDFVVDLTGIDYIYPSCEVWTKFNATAWSGRIEYNGDGRAAGTPSTATGADWERVGPENSGVMFVSDLTGNTTIECYLEKNNSSTTSEGGIRNFELYEPQTAT